MKRREPGWPLPAGLAIASRAHRCAFADAGRNRMAKWLGALVGLGGVCVATAAQAQTYPARPITLMVFVGPGGAPDFGAPDFQFVISNFAFLIFILPDSPLPAKCSIGYIGSIGSIKIFFQNQPPGRVRFHRTLTFPLWQTGIRARSMGNRDYRCCWFPLEHVSSFGCPPD